MLKLLVALLAVCFVVGCAAAEGDIAYLDVPEDKSRAEWIGFDARIADGMPAMRFVIEYEDSGYFTEPDSDFGSAQAIYRLTITEDGREVQSTTFPVDAETPMWIEPGDFYRYDLEGANVTLEDINGDGYMDIRYLYYAYPSNLIFRFLRWNPSGGAFEPLAREDGKVFALNEYRLFPDGTILNMFDDEYMFGVLTVYRWRDDQIVELRSSYWEDPMEDDEDNADILDLYVFDATVPEPGADATEADWLAYEEASTTTTRVAWTDDVDIHEVWLDCLFKGLFMPEGASAFWRE